MVSFYRIEEISNEYEAFQHHKCDLDHAGEGGGTVSNALEYLDELHSKGKVTKICLGAPPLEN